MFPVNIPDPSVEKLELVTVSDWPRRSEDIEKKGISCLHISKIWACTLVRFAPSKLVALKYTFEIFAPLTEVWMKSLPLRFILKSK